MLHPTMARACGLEVRLSDAYKSIFRSRQLVKISAVLIAMLIVGALVAIWGLRQGAINDTEDDNHRLGVVLAEQATRTFQGVDLVLQDMSDKIASTGIHDKVALHAAFGVPDIHEALIRRLKDLPQAGSFGILDADGELVNQTRRWPNPDYALKDRSYFQHFLMTTDPAAYVSEPLASRSTKGLRTMVLARRLTAKDGTFLGVVFAGIQLSFFDAFFAKIGFSDGTGITILRGDGVFLVHYPAQAGLAGSSLPANSPWFATVRGGGGHYRSPGIADALGARRVSVHPLSIYPIVVDVTRLEFSRSRALVAPGVHDLRRRFFGHHRLRGIARDPDTTVRDH